MFTQVWGFVSLSDVFLQEDHKSPIYGVAVNSRPNSVHSELVATAGANRISVYQMEDSERVVPLQVGWLDVGGLYELELDWGGVGRCCWF